MNYFDQAIMLNFFNIILSLYVWHSLANVLNYFNNNFKLSRMNISAVHALTVIFFYLFDRSVYILYYISLAYYIMDTKYELTNIMYSKKKSLYDFGIIIHHLLSMSIISYLLIPSVNIYVFYAYFLSEISNLPMYLAYHLIHINYPNKTLIRWITITEAFSFGFFRLCLGGYKAYQVWYMPDTPMFIIVSSVILLLISLIWTIKLSVQLMK
jgi:hypothetical protein